MTILRWEIAAKTRLLPHNDNNDVYPKSADHQLTVDQEAPLNIYVCEREVTLRESGGVSKVWSCYSAWTNKGLLWTDG